MSEERAHLVTGTIVEEEIELTLGELCRRCQVEADFIVELVQEGVIDPIVPSASRWTFTGSSLTRLRRARNLHRDLGLNLAGIALVLELLEERDRLYGELARWQLDRQENA